MRLTSRCTNPSDFAVSFARAEPACNTGLLAVPVRFTATVLKQMEAAAKANNQTVSEWVRSASQSVLDESKKLVEGSRKLVEQSSQLLGDGK
jgi:hypothetical protein